MLYLDCAVLYPDCVVITLNCAVLLTEWTAKDSLLKLIEKKLVFFYFKKESY